MTSRVVDIFIKGKDESSTAWKRAAQWATKFDASVKSNLKTLRDLSIVGVAAGKALRFLWQQGSAAIDAVEGQLKAETRLAISLGKVTREIDDQVKVYRSWAGAIQVATGIEDDHTLSMAATLQASGALPDTVRRATQAILDYSQITERSTTEAMEPMRRALGGQQAQWSRLGIAVDQSLPPQEQALRVIEQLEEKYGGAAHAIGQTAYGSIQRFKAAVGDLREMLGYAVIKTDTFNNVLDVLGFHLGEIDQEARSNQLAKMLDTLFKGALNGARAAINGILYFAEIVVRVLDSIRLSLGYVAQGLASFADAVSKSSAVKALGIDLTETAEGFQTLSDTIRDSGTTFGDWVLDLRGARKEVSAFFDALTKGNDRAASLRGGNVGLGQLGRFGGGGGAEVQDPLGPDLRDQINALSGEGNAGMEHLLSLTDQLREKLGGISLELQYLTFSAVNFGLEVGGAFAAITDSMANGVGTLLVDLREKAITGGEAVRKMANTIANQALASMGRAITKVILAPLDFALQKFTEFVTQLIWGAAIEKALQAQAAATALAIGIPTAKALELAWLPAATFASIATLGAAGVTGGLAVVNALAQAKLAATASQIPGAAEGAYVSGPSLLQVGEGRYPETVQPLRPGSAMELLSKSNSAAEFFGGGSPSIGSLTLNIQGGTDNPEKLAKLVSEAIANELRLLAGRRFA